MFVARRLAVALAVVGLGVLAYAGPATAAESSSPDCLRNPTSDQLIGTLDAAHGVARVRARTGLAVCADVLLTAYTVPETWNGAVFDASALPQHRYGTTTTGHVSGTGWTTLSVAVPTCGAVQLDLYTPPEIAAVTDLTGHRGHLVAGALWRWEAGGAALECSVDSTPAAPPTTPPTTRPTTPPAPPTPTTPPAGTTPAPGTAPPVRMQTVPATTPATPATTPATPATTPATAPADGGPAPRPTAPLAGVVPPGAAPGRLVTVPPVDAAARPSAPAPRVLAATGSDATIPLVAVGGGLLVAGLGLGLLGRRRRTT